jgi:hypothetical protein
MHALVAGRLGQVAAQPLADDLVGLGEAPDRSSWAAPRARSVTPPQQGRLGVSTRDERRSRRVAQAGVALGPSTGAGGQPVADL